MLAVIHTLLILLVPCLFHCYCCSSLCFNSVKIISLFTMDCIIFESIHVHETTPYNAKEVVKLVLSLLVLLSMVLYSSTRSLGRAQTAQALMTMNAIKESELTTKVSWGVSWPCKHLTGVT